MNGKYEYRIFPAMKHFPAETIIQAFGGQTKLAAALGHQHVTTVASWKKAGKIPSWRMAEIAIAAEKAGVTIPALPAERGRNDAA